MVCSWPFAYSQTAHWLAERCGLLWYQFNYGDSYDVYCQVKVATEKEAVQLSWFWIRVIGSMCLWRIRKHAIRIESILILGIDKMSQDAAATASAIADDDDDEDEDNDI